MDNDVKQMLEDMCVLISGKKRYYSMNEFGKKVYHEALTRCRQIGDNTILLRATELQVQKLQSQLKMAEMHRDALNEMASGNNEEIACQPAQTVV